MIDYKQPKMTQEQCIERDRKQREIWLKALEPYTPQERAELVSFWISGGCDSAGPIGFRA